MTIALLIDADNVSASHHPKILAQAQALGEVPIRRAFFAQAATEWAQVAGVRPVFAGGGKTSADLLMTIEAMELALHGKVERFVLVSSDGDFSHLALRLREYGLEVLGMGTAKAPAKFREACTGFKVLPQATEPAPPAQPKPMPVLTPPARPIDPAEAIEQEVGRLIAEHGGKVQLTDLNAEVRRRIGLNISAQPEKTWRAYLLKRPHLFAIDPKGPGACVRRVT